MEKNARLSGIVRKYKAMGQLSFIRDKELVNQYCFGNPTIEQKKELHNMGFCFWSMLQDPETKEFYEMWMK